MLETFASMADTAKKEGGEGGGGDDAETFLRALLARQRARRGDKMLLVETMRGILAFVRGGGGDGEAEMKMTIESGVVATMCACGVAKFLVESLKDMETAPHPEAEDAGMKVVEVMLDTREGRDALYALEGAAVSRISWMVVEKFGDQLFPGIADRIRQVPEKFALV